MGGWSFQRVMLAGKLWGVGMFIFHYDDDDDDDDGGDDDDDGGDDDDDHHEFIVMTYIHLCELFLQNQSYLKSTPPKT